MARMLLVYTCLHAAGDRPPLEFPSLAMHAHAASAWFSLLEQCVFHLRSCVKWIPTHLASPWIPKLISSSLSGSLVHPWFFNSSETMFLAFLATVMASGCLPRRRLGRSSVVQLKSSTYENTLILWLGISLLILVSALSSAFATHCYWVYASNISSIFDLFAVLRAHNVYE